MEHEIDRMLSNPYAASLAFVSVAVLALIVFLFFFEFVTRYDCWKEIRKGNMAVAMATGGKIFGICNIFRFSIEATDSVYQSMIWATFGFLLLLAAYFLFEFLTPVFRIDEEIERDNRAVGFIAMIISVSLSYVIGATVV
ncbi:putative membrane protein [Paenibacillus phyllosphaerae]|uniref:Putative membrane protein n=2 Tax=Paenibacillus phyllosphaerae TaxID=274593 RepID=A0A7W5FRI6_9BACL|nr:putative membrane protein [Paenibacillus phyllosphaerae]